jgi:hypothetical protein
MFTKHEQIEKLYKAGWHAAIAGVGIYEYRVHKTWLGKVLAVGLIAFHTDAAVCDWKGIPTTPQRVIKKVLDRRAKY